MRFLHTSDWHLGRIFHGVHLTEDQAVVLDQFVNLVGDSKPDAVVIAGDVFDRAVPPPEAVQLLDETLSRILLDYQIPVIMIAGNHDSPERLGFGNRLLSRQGLHVVGPLASMNDPVVINDAAGPVYFLPMPYAESAVVRSLLDENAADCERAMQAQINHVLRQVPADARTVAIAHSFISGGESSESERFLSVGGVETVTAGVFSRFNYTALGHLHKPQTVGKPNIRYSGSLLKYSFSESDHEKGLYLVDINQQGEVSTERIKLAPRRDVRCVEGMLEDFLKRPKLGESVEDYLQITLQDDGPVLDPMGRLRAIYPNVLEIQRTQLNATGELRGPVADHRRLTDHDLFASFFEQVTGVKLNSEQEAGFAAALEEVYRDRREVAG
ncbi:exonuclease sbcCD subunit D [Anaerosporomusa subterranea]|uniref:Nuclease SbcCD subunit D n=1 Tax=Anaerosporomusa subterranea TaxID=1794912 RepID=A0A154BPD4_ANASB|nr:exonuclease SbcCD subunit D [Anaerosporomusa subterranea]KYZ75796.1 exonuclease sbcCD subunit D [Anaerosporomusa subterranea]